MNKAYLRNAWKQEEEAAHIHGWDFSHIHDRYEEENDLPWDYEEIVRQYLHRDLDLLDYDTGGGEFLLSLDHPYSRTAATAISGNAMIRQKFHLKMDPLIWSSIGMAILMQKNCFGYYVKMVCSLQSR